MAFGRLDALVQALGHRHRPLRAEAEPAARLLLERRRRERGRRRSLLGARPELGDDRMQLADGRDVRSDVASSGMSRASPSIRTSSAANVLAGRGRQDRLDRPVLAGGEGVDLALALDDESDRDGLDATRRQAALDLLADERAERVADEAIDDPAGLLRVDEVLVDVAWVGERLADGGLGDLGEGHPARAAGRTLAASATCHAIASPSRSRSVARIDRVGRLGRLRDVGDLLAPVLGDDVFGLEVVVDVDAELALAGVLRQVADMAIRREDLVVGAEVALDGPGLCGGFDDDEVLGHGRECSTGSCTARYPAGDGQASRTRRRKSSSISRSSVVLGRSGAPAGARGDRDRHRHLAVALAIAVGGTSTNRMWIIGK